MNQHERPSRHLVLWILVSLAAATALAQQPIAEQPATHRSEPAEPVMTRATGTFDIDLSPRPPADGEGAAIGRMVLDKRFHGDLEATSQGQMLAFRTAIPGSAGYVAMEQVDGTLGGKAGTFVLQHSGTMDRGALHLTLAVVPDSATGDLTGLHGTMDIRIEDGTHFYDFDYAIAVPADDAAGGD